MPEPQIRYSMDRTRIIEQAFRLVRLAADLADRAQRFFGAVALSQHVCPDCSGKLEMVGDSRCRCHACQYDFDPTITFQRCSACGSTPRLCVRHYECGRCGAEVVSRFLFHSVAFDSEYFRQKMAEHRARKREQRERVRRLLAESRSSPIEPRPMDLEAIPGLIEALNNLTAGAQGPTAWQTHSDFDLARYEGHIQAHIGPIALTLDEIPPLGENARLDRIWRFIAIIFLAHAGLIEAWQDGPDVMVMQRETNREGQDVSGDLEDLDGVERPVGRIEA